jgi:hypothetical protein
MSPDPYHEAFGQTVDLQKFNMSKHSTGGLSLYERDGPVHLASISPSTLTARRHDWHAQIRGTWLFRVDKMPIGSIADVATAFVALRLGHTLSTTLLFTHLEIRPNLSQDGIPIVSSTPFSQLTHAMTNSIIDGSSQQWQTPCEHADHHMSLSTLVCYSMLSHESCNSPGENF